MPNPFVKLWRYLTASANAKIDEKADPKIQIQQAIEAEQQRHQALANQSAAVLGHQRQLEIRLNRQLGEVEELQAAEQARGAVEQSRMRLQTTLAERTKLMSQLEQAKMQEHVAASLKQVNELSAPGNTPSLGEVRDKIEARYANALGQAELAQTSVEGRMLEVQKATLDVAGASRLDQIRASMGQPAITGQNAAPALEEGTPSVPTSTAQQAAQPAD